MEINIQDVAEDVTHFKLFFEMKGKHMKKSDEFIVLGIDDGHGGTKLFAGLDAEGKEIKLTIPSIAYSGKVLNGDPENVDYYVVKVNDNFYTVGKKINSSAPLDTRTDEYPTSEYNKALIYQAIKAYSDLVGIPEGGKFAIATSLPVSRYYTSEKTKNTGLIDQKTDFLLNNDICYNLKDHNNGHKNHEIKRHIVKCEAQTAYFNEIIDIHGNPAENAKLFMNSECAVIDIGGKTTDIVVTLDGGNMIDASRSTSKDLGILSIKERIADLIVDSGIKKVNANWLDFALESGQYGIGNQAKDITPYIQQAKNEFMIQLNNFISKNIGEGDDLALIVFCGGGAAFMEKEISEKWTAPNVKIAESPSYANAKGLYKLAKYMYKLHKA